MLPTPITLQVDETNDSNPVETVYTAFRDGIYLHSGHTTASRDMLQFSSVAPKQSGNFYGVDRSTVKFTIDTVVVGVNGENIKVPYVVKIESSMPSGVSDALKMKMRQRVVSLYDLDSVMVPHQTQGQI